MASVNTYLYFPGNAEEAFNYYRSVFGGEFAGGIFRMSDVPTSAGMPPVPDAEKDLVMHVALPIFGGHLLMASDIPSSSGFKVNPGNNVYINLQINTRAETERLFKALSAGGKVEQELQDMFWGDYFGSFRDKFGVHWMLTCQEKK